MSLKNGSYGKLVKAYYAQQAEDSSSTKKTDSTKKEETTKQDAVSKALGTSSEKVTEEQKEYAATKTEANSVKADTSNLLAKGSASVFKQTDVKDSKTGLTTKQFDTDKIYSSVKKFVDDYNDLIKSTEDSKNSSIMQKGAKLMQNVASYKKELSDIGITINKDNTLSIDEKTFKDSSMSKVKDLFNRSDSLGGEVNQAAAEIENLASASASSNSLYTNNAAYNPVTGNLFSSYT